MSRKNVLTALIFPAVFGLGFFAFSSQAQAGTYYVCDNGPICAGANNSAYPDWQTGNNSNLCTSRSAPCKTIQGAIDKLPSSAPGYQVIVGNGVYVDKGGIYDSISNNPGCSHIPGGKPHWTTVYLKHKSGQPGKNGIGLAGIQNYDPDTWITFKTENKHGAILDSNKNTGNEAMGWCIDDSIFAFTIYNSDYIRVEGFEVREYARSGIGTFGGSNHVQLIDNIIHDIGYWCWVPPADSNPVGNAWQYGNGGAIGVQESSGDSHFLLHGNLIYNTGRLHIGQGGCKHYPGFAPWECDSNPQCYAMKYYDGCGPQDDYLNNINCCPGNPPYEPGCVRQIKKKYVPEQDYSGRDHWFYPAGGAKNIVFSNNIHYNNPGRDEFSFAWPKNTFKSIYIINNTFFDGESEEGLTCISNNCYGQTPGYMSIDGDALLYDDIKVINNVLYTKEKFWDNQGPSMIMVRGYGPGIKNIEAYNNLIYSPIRDSHTLFYSTTLKDVYDNGIWRGFTMDGNIHNQDPLFKDIENHNFTPLAGSPVCTGGTDGSYIGAIPCVAPPDINGDSKVNIKDIQECIRAIINPPGNPRADVNGDEKVNIKDIQAIIRVIVTP